MAELQKREVKLFESASRLGEIHSFGAPRLLQDAMRAQKRGTDRIVLNGSISAGRFLRALGGSQLR